jgi:hypothetical protein
MGTITGIEYSVLEELGKNLRVIESSPAVGV